ncbi:DUF6314 family protein [Amycolatopsis jiangsuensis]|uniref:DUF6314 domain-containing protein n=1 Tax=Amycolatopsis jiangsuensis TaxID=1181879 RepID=A0A840IKI9_9PSEU|nr:DUF6314 family protein [Amycolatopsis jiangsuensis]MBB4682841.1 hypothetical protein [Amycolatopsis jiangsuensis]
MAFPLSDLAGYFAGTWRLARDIAGVDGTGLGRASGQATFTLEDEVLVYHEAGQLDLGTHTGPFSRTLHYRITGAGLAAVHFDHGGFFHDLDLTTGEWVAGHPCRADFYRGGYLVLDRRSWRQEWTVRGPAKDHVITSHFTREDAAPGDASSG